MGIKQLLKKNEYINKMYVNYKWRERKVSYGRENPDKVFYVIRRAPCSIGLFSYVSTALGHIRYAVEQGYIPIVDMQNYSNTYLENKLLGKVNAWEYFFKQPMGYTLEDIKKSKHVILSWGEGLDAFPSYTMVCDESNYQMWYNCAQRYLHLSDVAQECHDRQCAKLLIGKRVVGVLCRGTDYVNNRPPRHPVQPEIGEVIKKTYQILKEEKCDAVFLATEDIGIYQVFLDEFGDRLITTDAKRYQHIGEKNINDITFNRENDCYLRGLEYLTTISLLASCTCLVAGCAGGTYGAMLLTQGYEKQYVFFNGCYPTEDERKGFCSI